MIYTVTFSPALDYIVDLDKLVIGGINRTKKETMMAGGKGINVSIVLSNLKNQSVAMGYLGGFVGQFIKDELTKKNINTDFVELDGITRINVKIKGCEETAINGQGPTVSEEKIEELLTKLEKLTSEDILVISGAIPSTMPSNTYEKILQRIEKQHVQLVVDTTGETLLKTLPFNPIMVKPNKEELEELFNTKIENNEQLVNEARKLIALGSQNVVVSLGGDGALLVRQDGSYVLTPSPKGKVVNTVGAGDSLVAGFIDEYSRTKDVTAAFKRGIACGSASAFSENLATYEEVENLLKTIK